MFWNFKKIKLLSCNVKKYYSNKIEWNALKELKERGFIYATTSNLNVIEKKLSKKLTSFYIGFDPTSDSLHLGNLLQIIALIHIQKSGHLPIALMGGATGLIGDPSGRNTERPLQNIEIIHQNTIKIQEILSHCLSYFNLPFKILNNINWYQSMNLIHFLRDIGKYFRVNQMIEKDSVKNRMEKQEGISFTEFTYQILQAFDFYYLFTHEGCNFQMGGSDQWGNITAGCDLIHKLCKNKDNNHVEEDLAFGITFPLLTTSDGKKLGKSTGIGETVWLSKHKTSVYDFYQYFLRISDIDAIKFLKLFTFLSQDEIQFIEIEHNKNPSSRIAHKKLAENITEFIHGKKEMEKVKQASEILFSNNIEMKWDILKTLLESNSSSLKNIPKIQIQKNSILGINIVELAFNAQLSPSKNEIKRLINSGGIYLNEKKIENLQYKIMEKDLIENKFCILRSGKKQYRLILII